MPGKRRDSHTIAVAERRAKVLAFRRAGASHRAIAVELGVDHSTISRDVKAIFQELAEEQHASAEEYRAMELERLDTLSLEASRILQAEHPLISGGKVLTRFTSDGKAFGLTDPGPKLQAIDRLLRISESRRKLLGLDAQPDAVMPGDMTIIVRWHDANRIIDVTPTDGATAPAPQVAESDSAALGALPMRVRWSEVGQVETSSDVEPEDRA
jgi:hypothetical protein